MSDPPESGAFDPGSFGEPGGHGQPGPYGQPGAHGQPGALGQPGPGWPQAAVLQPDSGPAPVIVSFPSPSDQRRLTVAFRAILVIPQFVVLGILSFVGAVVAFIGWWAALFTGRLPDWAFELLTGLVRWSARVSAYGYLITDRYPPFSLDDADYPVRVLTKPTPLNRLAVLFRWLLALPVGLVAGAASVGLAVLSVAAWLITVITGRMPTAMHEAFSAIIRFAARYAGYAYMVTPEYPSGLYGDQPEAAFGPTAPGFPPSQTAAEASPAASAAPYTQPDAVYAQPPSEPGVTADRAADPWRLVLSSPAKALVTASLVIGAVGLVAYVAFAISVGSSGVNSAVNRANALANVNSGYRQLDAVLRPFPTQTESCGQSLSCVTALDGKVADAFQKFGTSLRQAGIPTAYAGDQSRLATDTTAIAADFRRLAGAQSASQYEGIVAGMNITSTLSQWQIDFNGLESALTNG